MSLSTRTLRYKNCHLTTSCQQKIVFAFFQINLWGLSETFNSLPAGVIYVLALQTALLFHC